MERPRNWQAYYERKSEKMMGPARSLTKALEFVQHKDAALDLGAGSLQDARFLLNEGFQKVVAIDSEPLVGKMAGDIHDDRLEVVIERFETLKLPESAFDLANAQYSLPFTNPESFDAVFKEVRNSLKVGGIFVGQFLGKRDDWSGNPQLTFHDESRVRELLEGMHVIKFLEKEDDRTTVSGKMKHWHEFYVIARNA